MSSLLSELRSNGATVVPTRSVELPLRSLVVDVSEKDEDGDEQTVEKEIAPVVSMTLAYCDQDRFDRICKKSSGAKEVLRDPKFRASFFKAVYRGSTGLTKGNLRRMCEFFLLNPAIYAELPDGELKLESDADKDWFARNISDQHFNFILNSSLALEEYAREALEQEKKDSASSSSSPSVSLPQKSVDEHAV
jgi:hypothetical protein